MFPNKTKEHLYKLKQMYKPTFVYNDCISKLEYCQLSTNSGLAKKKRERYAWLLDGMIFPYFDFIKDCSSILQSSECRTFVT